MAGIFTSCARGTDLQQGSRVMAGHHHDHDHPAGQGPAGHSHGIEGRGDWQVAAAVATNLVLTAAQVAGGLMAGSVALIADAMHNLSDALALIIAFAARRIARRPAHPGMSFGYGRAEVVAALVNYTDADRHLPVAGLCGCRTDGGRAAGRGAAGGGAGRTRACHQRADRAPDLPAGEGQREHPRGLPAQPLRRGHIARRHRQRASGPVVRLAAGRSPDHASDLGLDPPGTACARSAR